MDQEYLNELKRKARLPLTLELIAEIERLQAKCNALIDALGESDYASYYPWLADREPSPDSRSYADEVSK